MLSFTDALPCRYCAEILASLPFMNADEPLYVVHVINRTTQLKGGALLGSLKTSLVGKLSDL
jgi:hypothetical protein